MERDESKAVTMVYMCHDKEMLEDHESTEDTSLLGPGKASQKRGHVTTITTRFFIFTIVIVLKIVIY